MRKLLILLTAFLVFLMPLQAEEPTEPETDTETETTDSADSAAVRAWAAGFEPRTGKRNQPEHEENIKYET